MNANDVDKKARIKRSHFLKKIVFIAILCVAIALSVFFFRGIYELWVSRHIRNVVEKQSIQLKKELNYNKQEGTMEIPNVWNADMVVVCRGYLHVSEQLKSSLIESGIPENIALRIYKYDRWSEGAHFYFIKKNRVLYSCSPRVSLIGKDFIFNKVGQRIYLDVILTNWMTYNIDDPNAVIIPKDLLLIKTIR